MLRFALASLSPIALLIAAGVLGGLWPLVALLFVTVFVTIMDQLPFAPTPEQIGPDANRHALALNVVLASLHIPLLFLGVWSIATQLEPVQGVLLAIALGLYLGQVGNSNAHELIHVSSRWPRRLGKAVFISLLFGHHNSAHLNVHHLHVATAQDPNTARKGEGFYRFWPRAWIGSFRAGLAAENAKRIRKSPKSSFASHPYNAYCGGGLAVIGIAYLVAGFTGVVVLIGICSYAQMQLLLADYVQHYGLTREVLPNGVTSRQARAIPGTPPIGIRRP